MNIKAARFVGAGVSDTDWEQQRRRRHRLQLALLLGRRRVLAEFTEVYGTFT